MITTPELQQHVIVVVEEDATITSTVTKNKNLRIHDVNPVTTTCTNKKTSNTTTTARNQSVSSIATETTCTTASSTSDDHSLTDNDDDNNDDDYCYTSTSSSNNNMNQIQNQTAHVTEVPELSHSSLLTTTQPLSINNNTIIDDDDELEVTTEDDIHIVVPADTTTMEMTTIVEAQQQQLPIEQNHVDMSVTKPRKSCLKDTSHESIPLRNTGWKNLPKLTNKNIQSKIIIVSVDNTKDISSKTHKKSVQFGIIEMRSYDICIGNNPSVTWGCPVQLDWTYVTDFDHHHNQMTVEQYEAIRSISKRRNMRQMMMNSFYRRNILLVHWGYTDEQITIVEKEMNHLRNQRFMTRTLLPLAPIEDCVTSLYRKVNRQRKKIIPLSSSTSKM